MENNKTFYILDKYEELVVNKVKETLGVNEVSIINPPDSKLGDITVPCFSYAKELKKSPQDIANLLIEEVKKFDFVEKVENKNGYLNIFFNTEIFVKDVLNCVSELKEMYGHDTFGNDENIVIDYSAPNIAKPFHIGHLRSTVIGGSLYKIYKFLGYNCIGINHLGDWGTQFGLLIAGYKRWGNDEAINKDPIKELVNIYVKINNLAKEDESVKNEAREWFKKLEEGDVEALRLWKWFRDESLKEFNRVYDMLGVTFDSYNGEAFYNDKMDKVIEMLQERNLLTLSQGAQIVDLEEDNMSPVMILKSNGTTTYHTRDIAALLYRINTYKFAKALYITSYEQVLHFKQLYKVVEKMGFGEQASKCTHVPFGMVHLKTGKMSTREGNIVYLEELLNESINKVEEIIKQKNPYLINIKDTAKKIGIGAIIFNDLKNGRIKDIVFDWDEILRFDGETGPYVQYTYVRIMSLLRKSENNSFENIKYDLLKEDSELDVVREIAKFNKVIIKAATANEPSILSRYVIDLAQSFSRLYNEVKFMCDDVELQNARLYLANCTGIVIKNCLNLLGIETVDEM